MHIGGLSIFSRTSSATRFNIASWHSPHSLTWRWVLSVGRQPVGIRPHAFCKSAGPHRFIGAGLGQLIAASASRNNCGWQFSFSLFWHAVEFNQQHPMWYRDMYMRERDQELEHDFASQRAPAPVAIQDHPTLQ